MPYSNPPWASNNQNHFYRLRPHSRHADQQVGLRSGPVIGSLNGSDAEIWGYRNQRLFNVSNSLYLGGSTSAETVNLDTAPQLTFEGNGNVFSIVNNTNGKHLRSSGNAVTWAEVSETPTSERRWVFEQLTRVTDLAHYPGNIGYFHERSGLPGGSANSTWFRVFSESIRNLYRCVYGTPANPPPRPGDSQILYNLYGSMFRGVRSGVFHTGVDMFRDLANAPIFCPFESGTVVDSDRSDNGRIQRLGLLAIRNNATQEIYVFMHMRVNSITHNVGDTVVLGDQIGIESDVGSPGSIHLHVEILRPNSTRYATPFPERSWEEIGDTIVPYNSFAMLPYVNFNPPTGGGVNTRPINVSYTEGGITRTTSFNINVVSSHQIGLGTSRAVLSMLESAEVLDQNLLWTSSNPNVATVSSDGVVSGLAEGITVIASNAEDGEFNTALAIIVVDTEYEVTTLSATERVHGESKDIEVTATYKNGTTLSGKAPVELLYGGAVYESENIVFNGTVGQSITRTYTIRQLPLDAQNPIEARINYENRLDENNPDNNFKTLAPLNIPIPRNDYAILFVKAFQEDEVINLEVAYQNLSYQSGAVPTKVLFDNEVLWEDEVLFGGVPFEVVVKRYAVDAGEPGRKPVEAQINWDGKESEENIENNSMTYYIDIE